MAGSKPNPNALTTGQLVLYKLRNAFALWLCAVLLLFAGRETMVHILALISRKFSDAPQLSNWLEERDINLVRDTSSLLREKRDD